MVFGWGKKKDPIPRETVASIQLDEAPRIARDVQAKRSDNTMTSAARILYGTNDLIRELANMRQDLEEDDLDMDKVDKRIRPLVLRGKKMLIESLRKNAIEIAPITVPDDMAQAAGEIEHRLKRLGNILGKQTRIIHIFAEEYAIRLKQILEEIEHNRRSIIEMAARDQADKAIANSVINGTSTVYALERSAVENLQKHDAAQAEARNLDSRITQLASKIDGFQKSDEYTHLLELEAALQRHQAKKSEIATEIATRFTSISRSLGRYERISADKDQTILLQKTQQNPYQVMRSQEITAVSKMLDGVLRAVTGGSISVKDTDKATEAIKKTSKSIPRYVEMVENIEAEIHKTQEMIQNSEPTRLHEMEQEMISLQESKKTAVQRDIDTMAAVDISIKSIPAEILEVQRSLLRLTGTRYNIEYSSEAEQ